jgi:hypothetical protein
MKIPVLKVAARELQHTLALFILSERTTGERGDCGVRPVRDPPATGERPATLRRAILGSGKLEYSGEKLDLKD